MVSCLKRKIIPDIDVGSVRIRHLPENYLFEGVFAFTSSLVSFGMSFCVVLHIHYWNISFSFQMHTDNTPSPPSTKIDGNGTEMLLLHVEMLVSRKCSLAEIEIGRENGKHFRTLLCASCVRLCLQDSGYESVPWLRIKRYSKATSVKGNAECMKICFVHSVRFWYVEPFSVDRKRKEWQPKTDNLAFSRVDTHTHTHDVNGESHPALFSYDSIFVSFHRSFEYDAIVCTLRCALCSRFIAWATFFDFPSSEFRSSVSVSVSSFSVCYLSYCSLVLHLKHLQFPFISIGKSKYT